MFHVLNCIRSNELSATDDLLDLDMSGQNTLTNIMAMHSAKQQQQQMVSLYLIKNIIN